MIRKITNQALPYAWGSKTLISDYLGYTETGGPMAEIWFGTHPGSMAYAEDSGVGLLELRGGPVPPVPALPGVVHRCADGPGTEAEVAFALAAGDVLAVAGLAGCSAARAAALIAQEQTRGGAVLFV